MVNIFPVIKHVLSLHEDLLVIFFVVFLKTAYRDLNASAAFFVRLSFAVYAPISLCMTVFRVFALSLPLQIGYPFGPPGKLEVNFGVFIQNFFEGTNLSDRALQIFPVRKQVFDGWQLAFSIFSLIYH